MTNDGVIMAQSKLPGRLRMKAEIDKLRAQGLSDAEIADVIGVEERIVAMYEANKPGPAGRGGKLTLVTEDEAAEFTDIMKGLARHSELDTVRASCAKWLVNEHFGRNDANAGVSITNNNFSLVVAAIQAANAKQMAKLGLTPPAPARLAGVTDFDELPAPPPTPAPQEIEQ